MKGEIALFKKFFFIFVAESDGKTLNERKVICTYLLSLENSQNIPGNKTPFQKKKRNSNSHKCQKENKIQYFKPGMISKN